MKNVALSLEEIRKRRKAIPNVNILHREKLTTLERFAVWVTRKIGTMGFFLFLLTFNIAWILWNVFAPAEFVFDSSWSFLILLFINNILQILFMPLIMVGQNLDARHSEARAQADYDVNSKAESEIENILMHLENQNEMMERILEKVNK